MKIAYGILVNNIKMFERFFLSQSWCKDADIFMKENPESAAKGLNLLLSRMRGENNDIGVFIHQDVQLPVGWEERTINQLKMIPDFVVAGVCGVDKEKNLVGHIKDGREVYTVYTKPLPKRVIALDECCLIINLKSDFIFDEVIEGFDLYGTDIVLSNRDRSYVIDSMLYHMSTRDFYSPGEDEVFMSKWKYLENKYPNELITSTVHNCIYAYNGRAI